MQTMNQNQSPSAEPESAESSDAASLSRFGLNSMDFENAVSVFFDTDAIREPAYFLYRADGGSSNAARWYWEPDGDRYYGSTTSVISATQPTPYGILEWLKTMGQAADAYRDLRGRFGTWLHVQIVRLLIEGEISLKEAVAAMPDDGLELEGQKGILSFEAWRRQYQVKPLAIEAVLKSDELGVAGAVDLLALMRIGSGKGGNWLKKDATTGGLPCLGIVDYKSGLKGFYPEHAHQLRIYRALVEENFPEIGQVAADHFRAEGDEIEGDLPVRIFNWSPSDWRTAPGWKLKEHHEETQADRSWRTMIRLFNEQNSAPKPRLAIAGTITRDVPLSELYRFETIKDRVTETDELTRSLEASIEKEADQ